MSLESLDFGQLFLKNFLWYIGISLYLSPLVSHTFCNHQVIFFFFLQNSKNDILWNVSTHLTTISQVLSFELFSFFPKMLQKSQDIIGHSHGMKRFISFCNIHTVLVILWDLGQISYQKKKKGWIESSGSAEIIWVLAIKLEKSVLRRIINLSKPLFYF